MYGRSRTSIDPRIPTIGAGGRMGPSPAGTQGRCVLREFRRRGGGRERGSFSIKSVTVVTVYVKRDCRRGRGEGIKP